MPYPMLTLPYPFTRRLRQLLTPNELQRFQTAAGNNIRDLKPLITTATFDFFDGIWIDSHIDYQCDEQYVQTSAAILKLKVGVVFARFSKSNFNYLPFEHIETPFLEFYLCQISNELLQRASTTIQTKRIIFACKESIEEDVTFLTVANIFPDVNLIVFNALSMSQDENVKNIQKGEDYLIIHHREFSESFFCVNSEEIYNFIKSRSAEFCLYILYYPYTDDELRNDYVDKLTPLFEDRFDKVEYGHPKIHIEFPLVKMSHRFEVTYYFKEE